jgi:hypothetical protein
VVFLLAEGLVRSGVEEVVQVSGVGELDLDHPAGAIRLGVDGLGSAFQRLVDGDDLAADRGEDVRDGLDDSTTPNCSCAFRTRPTAGTSTKTTSPR